MNERIYQIMTLEEPVASFWEWSLEKEKEAQFPVFRVDQWRDEGETGPETFGRLLYLPDQGLDIALWCYETHPRAIYHNPNDFVHTDSCMEAFINVFPEVPQLGYISVEMNHNAASHCSFGTGRYTRKFVLERGLAHPQVQVTDFEEEGRKGWCTHVLLKRSLLEALYERPLQLAPGHAMRANFYKCGDHMDHPHWASWAPVNKLDFHTPETFGNLVVTTQ